MNNSRSKELTKNTFIITLGRISTQFITFLLLPLYTALLTTKEYGTVDLVMTLVQLLIPVMSVMIDQGVFRYLLNCGKEEDKKRTISSAFFVLILTSIATIAIYALVSLFYVNEYKIWLLLILIATAFSNLFLQIARGLKHTSDYALGSFVCSASTIVLNVICIAAIHMGAVGMLVATFAGNAICCIFLFFKLRIGRYIGIKAFDKEIAKDELKYSIPLVPNQLSLWVMNSSDRLIVTFFLGTAANGILAVSHKFPAIFMTFFNIFQMAWHETGAIHYFDEDRDEFFTDMVKKMLAIFSTLCMCVIVALPLVFDWFVNSAYGEAYNNIPIYLVASLFNVVIGLLGVVYVATKKTTEIAKTTILAAVINIIVNVGLIKFLGLYAASISTLIGYLVTMIYRIADTKNYLRIKYDIKQILGISVSVIICCFIYYLNNKIVSLVFLPIFIIFAYLFNKKIVDGILQVAEKKTSIAKKKIMAAAIAVLAVIILIGGLVVYKKMADKAQEIQKSYENEIETLEAEDVISFADFGSNSFTCTGLTYDSSDDTYWIGDYGALTIDDQPEPRIIEVDKNFTSVISEIQLSEVLDKSANLQGVTYDKKDNSLWLAIGESIVEISKDGEVLKNIDMSDYADNISNGICYCEADDSIWVLCTSQYLLHYDKEGNLLSDFAFNYADQDHICIDGDYILATVGADYQGDDNYICKISMEDGNVVALYRTNDANSLEGICIVDGKVLIANDGLYHSDLKGHSYIIVYDAEQLK